MNAIDSTTVDSSISTFSVFHLISWRINFSDSSQAASKGILSRSEEHTSELQSQSNLVCRLLLEKKKNKNRSLCSTAAQRHPFPGSDLALPSTDPLSTVRGTHACPRLLDANRHHRRGPAGLLDLP